MNKMDLNNVEFLITTEEAIDIFNVIDDVEIDNILYSSFKKNLSEGALDTIDNEIDEQLTICQAVTDYQNGITEAFNYIYTYYKPIVERWAYRSEPYDFEKRENLLNDMLHFQLLDCIDKWSVNCGTKFNTFYQNRFAWTAGINKKYSLAQKRNGVNISINQKFGGNNTKDGEGATVEEYLVANEVAVDKNEELKMCIEQMSELTAKEKQMIKLMIDNFTQTEIAKIMGLTVPAVNMGMRRIAKKSVGKKIRALLTT